MANSYIVLVLCCTIVLTAVGCAVLDPDSRLATVQEITANQEKAIDVINALAQYHQSVGSFPESLEDLVPGYLFAIPETVEGQRFVYHRDDLSGYHLCFYLPGYRDAGCCFHQYICLWECSNARE